MVSADLPAPTPIRLRKYIDNLENATPVRVRGRVTEVTGLIIKAAVPGVRLGEVCVVRTPHASTELRTEVVGFKDEAVFLMPLGEARDLGPDSEVIPTGKPFCIRCGWGLLGRVLNGIGE